MVILWEWFAQLVTEWSESMSYASPTLEAGKQGWTCEPSTLLHLYGSAWMGCKESDFLQNDGWLTETKLISNLREQEGRRWTSIGDLLVLPDFLQSQWHLILPMYVHTQRSTEGYAAYPRLKVWLPTSKIHERATLPSSHSNRGYPNYPAVIHPETDSCWPYLMAWLSFPFCLLYDSS